MSLRKTEIVNSNQESTENFLESYPQINLLGWPGYRNSYNKSGLGYFESNSERGHMQGLFLRWIFTGKFRTHNPIFLFVMLSLGLFCGAFPLIAIFIELLLLKNYGILWVFIFSSPYMAVGLALLVNFFLSIFDWNGKSITGD